MRESRIAVVALFGIAVLTALVIAAWRFGGPEREGPSGLKVDGGSTTGATSAPGGRAVLSVRAADGASWMVVRVGSSSGRLVYSGTLERGQSQRFEARRLQLALAEPDNVVVRLNGRRVTLPEGTAFVVTSRRIAPAAS